jgi:hypothetical protein
MPWCAHAGAQRCPLSVSPARDVHVLQMFHRKRSNLTGIRCCSSSPSYCKNIQCIGLPNDCIVQYVLIWILLPFFVSDMLHCIGVSICAIGDTSYSTSPRTVGRCGPPLRLVSIPVPTVHIKCSEFGGVFRVQCRCNASEV